MKNLKIYANELTLDQKAVHQVHTLLEQEAFANSKVRIMPDVHAGKGCVVGFTADLGEKVIPNVVGVDIGCGVLVYELGKIDIDFEKLDEVIRKEVPSGFSIRTDLDKIIRMMVVYQVSGLRCANKLRNVVHIYNSLGTLGGGNHFIEVDEDDEGNKYLVIHTGSRNLGKQVAEIYQDLAINSKKVISEEVRNDLIARLKAENRHAEIPSELRKLTPTVKVPDELAYLEGQDRLDYLHDMEICQKFASSNRDFIATTICIAMGWGTPSSFESVHNYISFHDNIVRKGAISAHEGERVIIPINMQQGSLIGVGKGNLDWNNSAPHGAGRALSRSQAKETLTMEDFRHDMKDIFSTSVDESTLDESPRAYKPIQDILDFIGESVEVEKIIRPIYNFKASGQKRPWDKSSKFD